MLSDAQWSELEPLVEACRPKAKTPPQDLQRTLSAILWRHQNGAKWRAIPEELGPWWRAAQIFIRWSRAGVWERLLGLVQERGVQLGMMFLDGTIIRAHQKAAGAANVWPAPSASGLDPLVCAVCINVSGLPASRWSRWKSARSGPHKGVGVERHFCGEASRTPVDCQAIFLSPPADIGRPARPRRPNSDQAVTAAGS